MESPPDYALGHLLIASKPTFHYNIIDDEDAERTHAMMKEYVSSRQALLFSPTFFVHES
jgi:hypothetical protein